MISHDLRRLSFYLAADSADAYNGLVGAFPGRVLYTTRPCATQRCDFRDCDAMRFSLVDMLNLAATRLILGSGYSSYSEVAAQMGDIRIQMAGRDFGNIVKPSKHDPAQGAPGDSASINPAVSLRPHNIRQEIAIDEEAARDRFLAAAKLQVYWPKPFGMVAQKRD